MSQYATLQPRQSKKAAKRAAKEAKLQRIFDNQIKKQKSDAPASLTNKQKKMLRKQLQKSLQKSLQPVVDKYSKGKEYPVDKVVYDDSEDEQDYGVAAEEDVESMDEHFHEHHVHHLDSESESIESGESAEEYSGDEQVEWESGSEDSQVYHQVAEDGMEMDDEDMDPQEFEEKMDELFDIEEQLMELGTNQHEDEVALVTEYENARSELFDARAQVIASMPGFWATAVANHPVFGSLIYSPPSGSMLDAEILDYLESVNVDRHPDDFRDITVSFTFVENPFFTNQVLRKSFRWEEETEEFEVYQTTKIQWTGGLQYLEDGLEHMQHEAASGKRGGDRRLRKLAKQIKKGLRRERHLAASQTQSIFTWFEDEEEVSVGILIAEDLYGRATHWFLGLDDQAQSDDEIAGSESEGESGSESESVSGSDSQDEEIDSDEAGSMESSDE